MLDTTLASSEVSQMLLSLLTPSITLARPSGVELVVKPDVLGEMYTTSAIRNDNPFIAP